MTRGERRPRLVLARYLLPIGLSVLLLAAIGAASWRAGRRGWPVGLAVAACLAAAALGWQPSLPTAPGTGRFVRLDDIDQMRRLGIRYVLLHRNPEDEVPWVAPARQRRRRFDLDACSEMLVRLTGRRPRVDQGVAWFDLADEGRP